MAKVRKFSGIIPLLPRGMQNVPASVKLTDRVGNQLAA